MGQKPVNAGHAHIVKPGHGISQKFRGQGRFLRHALVAGAAGGDDDAAHAPGIGHFSGNAHPGGVIIGDGHFFPDQVRLFFVQPGDQHVFLAALPQGLQDARNLPGGFPGAVDNLPGALPDPAVQVHLGIADVLKGFLLQPQQSLVNG